MVWYPVLLLGCAALSSAAPSFTVKGSRPTILEGVGFQLDLALSYPSGDNLAAGSSIYVRVQKGSQPISGVKTYPLYSGDELRTSLTLSDLVLNEVGTHELTVDVAYSADFLGASSGTYDAWVISGFVSLLPPLFVVLVAGLTQEVLWALWVGLFVAGAIVHQGNIFDAFLRTLDTYLVNSLADSGHAFVILFSWFLAGLVAVVQKSGGGHGIANIMLKRISTRRGVQLAVYLLGFVIFFDDYANTLILGNTMRGRRAGGGVPFFRVPTSPCPVMPVMLSFEASLMLSLSAERSSPSSWMPPLRRLPPWPQSPPGLALRLRAYKGQTEAFVVHFAVEELF